MWNPVTKINLQVNIVYPWTVPSCALLLRSGPSLRLSSTSTSAPSSNAGSSSYSSRGVGQQDAIRNICRTTRNSASFRSRLSNSDMVRPARHVGQTSGYWRHGRKRGRSLENLLANQDWGWTSSYVLCEGLARLTSYERMSDMSRLHHENCIVFARYYSYIPMSRKLSKYNVFLVKYVYLKKCVSIFETIAGLSMFKLITKVKLPRQMIHLQFAVEVYSLQQTIVIKINLKLSK